MNYVIAEGECMEFTGEKLRETEKAVLLQLDEVQAVGWFPKSRIVMTWIDTLDSHECNGITGEGAGYWEIQIPVWLYNANKAKFKYLKKAVA